jgi:hypothetical protein
MQLIHQGTAVLCSQGHVNGHTMRDIAADELIEPRDFGLEEAAKTTTAAGDGHVCSECGERITRYRTGSFQIHTGQGWIGRFTVY